MPLRTSKPLPLLALTLACGGGSSTPSTPQPVPRKAEAPSPAPCPRALAFEPRALTCAPGDPILLVPAPGGLGDQPATFGIRLEARPTGAGPALTGGHLVLGHPGQPVLSLGRAPQTPGSSDLRIRAQVDGAWTAPAGLSVNVEPASAVAAGLRINPSAVTVAPGGRLLFRAVLPMARGGDGPKLAFGTATEGAGTVQRVDKALFLYQAPAEPGTYQVVLTSIADGSRAQAVITVVQPAS